MSYKKGRENAQDLSGSFDFEACRRENAGQYNYIAENYPMTYEFLRQGHFEDKEIAATQVDDLTRLEKSFAKAYSVKSPAICERDIIHESGYYAGLHQLLENKNQTEKLKKCRNG